MSDVLSIEVRNARRNFVAARVSRNLSGMHLHDTFTVCLMRKGLIEFSVRERVLRAAPGDVFVIHPYEVHWGGNPRKPIEYDVFYVTPELMNDWTRQKRHLDGFPQLASQVIPDGDLARPIFEAVDGAGGDAIDPEAENRLADEVANLFAALTDGRRTTGVPIGLCRAVERASQILHERAQNDVDLAQLASEVGVSRYHFSRLFRRITGMTPSSYLRHVRLSRAMRCILAGESLSGSAYEAGFADHAHMTRTFREVYGFAPSSLVS